MSQLFASALRKGRRHGRGNDQRRNDPVRKSAVDMFVSVSTDVAKRNGVYGTALPQRIIPNFTDVAASEEPAPADLFAGPCATGRAVHLVRRRPEQRQRLARPHRGVPQLATTTAVGHHRPAGRSTTPELGPKVTVINGWPYVNVVEAFSSLCVLRGSFPMGGTLWFGHHRGHVAGQAGHRRQPRRHHDIIEDGETGFLIEPRNVPELKERLATLTANVALRAEMGKKAKESVKRFDVDIVISQIEALYEELIASTAEKASARTLLDRTMKHT